MAWVRSLLERRARPLSRRTQLLVVLTTTVALAVVTVWAWRSAHLSFSRIHWLDLTLAFAVAAPATLALKMLEYDATARLVEARTTVRRALEVSVVSSAANLLPIPGSLLVTTRSLSEQGVTYGSAAVASTIPGLAWLGLSGVIGGAAIVVAGSAVVGVLVIAGGVAAVLGAGAVFRRSAPAHRRVALASRIVVVELSWIVLSAFRFWLVLGAIGVHSTAAQGLALGVAGAMSTAIGFLPGGLGAREALIALLSPVIKLTLSDGVLLGAIDRVVWLTFLSVAAVAVAGGRTRSRDAVPASTEREVVA